MRVNQLFARTLVADFGQSYLLGSLVAVTCSAKDISIIIQTIQSVVQEDIQEEF